MQSCKRPLLASWKKDTMKGRYPRGENYVGKMAKEHGSLTWVSNCVATKEPRSVFDTYAFLQRSSTQSSRVSRKQNPPSGILQKYGRSVLSLISSSACRKTTSNLHNLLCQGIHLQNIICCSIFRKKRV